MIAFKPAPVGSKSDTLTVERRWANATQADLDKRMREVRATPESHPEYTVANDRLYHTSVEMGRRVILSLEERDAVFAREYARYDQPSLSQFVTLMRNKYVNASKRKVERHYRLHAANQIHAPAVNKRLTRRALWSSNALSFLAMDLIDQTNNAKSGYRYILVIIDVFSRFCWALPLRNKQSQTVADAFRTVIQQYSLDHFLPNLVSDQGTEFLGAFRTMCEDEYGLKMIQVKTYMGVAMVERMNRTIREGLGRAKTRGEANWVRALPNVVHRYNTLPHGTTKTPPFISLNGWLQQDGQLIQYVRERNRMVAERSMSKEGNRLPPGSRVRVSLFALSSAFRRIAKKKGKSDDKRKLSEMPTWTVSIFTVRTVSQGTSRAHAVYQLVELRGRYFRNELQLVSNESEMVDDIDDSPFQQKNQQMSSLESNALDQLDILVNQNDMSRNPDAQRFIGAMVRRTFTDVGEQYGKVVAYIPPDDTSEDMELGERWVVEYQTNGKQELLMSSEVLVSIDAEVSGDMRAADEEEEEKEEIVNDDAQPVRKLTALERRYLGMIVEADPDNDSDAGTVIKVNKKSVWIRWKEPFDTADDGTPNFIQRNKPMAEIKQYERDYGLAKDDVFLNSLNIQQA